MTSPSVSHIPGPRALPIVGHTVNFLRNASGFFLQQQRQYGDVFRFQVLGSDVIGIAGQGSVQELLVRQQDKFENQAAWEMTLGELFPNGLMLMDGDRHHHHRNLMRAAFTREALAGYLPMMIPIVDRCFDEWTGRQTVQAYDDIKVFTLRVAMQVFFGLQPGPELDALNRDFQATVYAATAIPIRLPFTPYGKGVAARKRLGQFFAQLVPQRRAAPGPDLLSLMCQARGEQGEQLTDQEIVDQSIFMLMAAHDTTASTLTSLLSFTAQHRDWQEAIRQEYAALTEVEQVDVKALSGLTQTQLVIKETLRLMPPLILLPRVAREAFDVAGYHIPAGSRLAFLLQNNHLDGDVWTDEATFDPLRFAKPRQEQLRCPFHHAPFGASKHYCLGFAFAEMQLALMAGRLAQRYRWSVPAGYQMPVRNVPIQQPKDGLPLHLTPRD
jgi:cytochrome P450